MIDLSPLAPGRYAVLGLGRTGLAAARALAAGGLEVLAWDDGPARREAAAAEGLALVDLLLTDLAACDALVLSPGIPHTHPAPHPVAARAKAAGCPILSDVELLGRVRREARFVGITGTNGKSTTTALLGHILRSAGIASEVGGNLGPPALGMAPLGADGAYVLELSSYQLEITPELVFDVAVLLNVAPDHLDRHGGMEGYVAAKKRIFAGQGPGRTAVVGIDDERSAALCDELDMRADGPRVVPVAGWRKAPGGVYADGRHLRDDTGGADAVACDLTRARALPGRHNGQNAAAAYAAARALGVAVPVVVAAIESFPGLAHRQELVGEVDGIRYVNDSKATNADAAARALESYERIYWIAGGRPKEGGIASLAPLFPRVLHAFLIGEAAEDFARTLDGRVPFTRCGDLARAVSAARDLAAAQRRPGAVVLLSPACASFDQFENFEARGDAFRTLVSGLAAVAGAA